MNAPHRRKEWLEFKDWCAQRRLKAFPAHPWTLAAYIVWLDAHRRGRTLHKRMDIIARVHIRACIHSPDRDPLVERTLTAIERRRQTGSHKSFNAKDLLDPKKKNPTAKSGNTKRVLRHVPPLVSKRPRTDA